MKSLGSISNNKDVITKEYVDNAINNVGGETHPVGTILVWSGLGRPSWDYMLCQGQELSRTTYKELFDVIGTAFGAGDGSTTFNLPNLKGKVPVGQDASQTEFTYLGQTGGEKTHTLTIQEMPSHSHTAKGWAAVVDGSGSYITLGGAGGSQEYSVNVTGGGQPMNNLQPYVVVNYIIKVARTTITRADIVNTFSTATYNGYSCNYVNYLHTYRTEETRVGTWIDGKPIYRKVLTVKNTSGSNVSIAHNISNLKTVISHSVRATNNNGNTYPEGNDIYPLYFKDIDFLNVWCNISGAFDTGWTIIVTIEYTKTTD